MTSGADWAKAGAAKIAKRKTSEVRRGMRLILEYDWRASRREPDVGCALERAPRPGGLHVGLTPRRSPGSGKDYARKWFGRIGQLGEYGCIARYTRIPSRRGVEL